MNFNNLKLLIVILSFAFISCAQNTAKKEVKDNGNNYATQDKQVVELISPKDLNAKLGDIQLIDVRTPEEYTGGYIEGAININFFDSDFNDQMAKLNKDKELYIYCRSGKRSGKAAKRLKDQGFTKIYDLQGGILNWNKNKLMMVK
jgi:rhodanese-related sulfurtransferase